jgi:hypothetical protein
VRAQEARSYVRALVAERGWTEEIDREARRILAAALAAEGLPGCACPACEDACP